MSTRPLVGAAIATCSRSCAIDVAVADHHQTPIDRGAQGAILRLELPLPKGVPHGEHRLLQRQRLLDEVVRAELDRPHRRFDVAVAGDHDDGGIDTPLAQALQRGEAVDAGQPDVEDDEVERPAREPIEAGFAARHRLDRVALVFQNSGERRPNARFVIDDRESFVARSRFMDLDSGILVTAAARS